MSGLDAAFQVIAARGGDAVEAPIILPAAVPLELSGEVVRGRICTFTDEDGQEWALRPDLTLPIAKAEIEARSGGDAAETIRHYRGSVFRLPAVAGEPVEYEQMGLERFGAPRSVDADLWLFETLAEASIAAGVDRAATSIGDLSIFPAIVDALGLADELSAGLKRAFRQEGGVHAYLAGQNANHGGLTGRLRGLPREEVSAFVQDIFAMTGVRPVGERTGDEIVERLYQRAQSTREGRVSDDVADFIERVLALDVPIGEAAKALSALIDEAGLTGLDSLLDRFSDLMTQIGETGVDGLVRGARFATEFGRRFTYYDGFVFELAADESDVAKARPFATGGRYDSLLSNLSNGAVEATAIGGILNPHRLTRIAGVAA